MSRPARINNSGFQTWDPASNEKHPNNLNGQTQILKQKEGLSSLKIIYSGNRLERWSWDTTPVCCGRGQKVKKIYRTLKRESSRLREILDKAKTLKKIPSRQKRVILNYVQGLTHQKHVTGEQGQGSRNSHGCLEPLFGTHTGSA